MDDSYLLNLANATGIKYLFELYTLPYFVNHFVDF